MVLRLLAGAGAGATWPLVAASYPVLALLRNEPVLDDAERLGSPDWKPLVLNTEQNESLTAIAESIVPGATKAQVNRFIDLLLSGDTGEHKESFVHSVAAVGAGSQKRFGKGS